MADLRLFIAVELPEAWTEALAAMQDALRGHGLERLRWVRPEGAHLTLMFLGNVDEARVPDVTGALTRAVAGRPPFSLALAGAGAFGPPNHPRVVWAGVRGDVEPLAALHRAVAEAMQALGFPRERERFIPHLTLARVPDGLAQELRAAIVPALGRLPRPAAPPLEVREIALMRSELAPGGARYTRLAAAPLQEK